MRPNDRRYRESHEWAQKQGEDLAVGITDHAVEQLGDLTFLEIKAKVGQKVKAGDLIAEIESVKTVADIYAPVDGEITAVNAPLGQDVEPLGQSPFEKGWIVKLRPAAAGAYDALLDAAAYEKAIAAH
jgi:glycine cleavage system H protein